VGCYGIIVDITDACRPRVHLQAASAHTHRHELLLCVNPRCSIWEHKGRPIITCTHCLQDTTERFIHSQHQVSTW